MTPILTFIPVLPSHPSSSTSILILPFNLLQGLLNDLFPSRFSTKNLHVFNTSPIYLIQNALYHKISLGYVRISCPTTHSTIVYMHHKSLYRLFICNINLLAAVDTSLAKMLYYNSVMVNDDTAVNATI
jgi:hypothetical protein